MARIALLEDEPDLRQEIARFLEDRGHEVLQAGSLGEFRTLHDPIDVGVFDLMLPDGHGLEAVSWLRARHAHAGVIVLTARGSLHDRLQGLDGGADHYLVKPFSLAELAAIIQSLLRRLGAGWRLDGQHRQLIGPTGDALALSRQEMVLFELLSERLDVVVSRRTLVEALGANWLDFDLRRLDTMVSRLRRRWRESAGSDLPLKTEHRYGYSFGDAIERI